MISKTRIRLIYLILEYLQIQIYVIEAGFHQKRLIKNLFKDYNNLERPVLSDNESLKVQLGMAIQQIVDIDERKQAIIFSGWLDIRWTDYNLRWNPAKYGNITRLRIESTKIWIPDLLLFNSVDDHFETTSKVNAVIDYDGSISYLPPGIFKSSCLLKINDFPFDEQICKLKFGSWTFDEKTINLSNKSSRGQMNSYVKNSEWFLIDVKSYTKSISYVCCPEKYPFVIFEIHVRRRTLYFIFNIIFPCNLISFMSLLGFVLPPNSGEKVGLGVAVLLSIIMFSNFINQAIPKTSLYISKIAIHFTSVMVLIGLSVIANVFVLVFHHRNVKFQEPMPEWIDYYICNIMARLVGMEFPLKHEEDKKNLGKRKYKRECNYKEATNSNFGWKMSLATEYKSNMNSINCAKSKILDDQIMSFRKIYFDLTSLQQSLENDLPLLQNIDENIQTAEELNKFIELDLSLNVILKNLKIITQKIKDEERDERRKLKWKFAGNVIDRFCLILFSIANLVSLLFILVTCENFFKSSNPSLRF